MGESKQKAPDLRMQLTETNLDLSSLIATYLAVAGGGTTEIGITRDEARTRAARLLTQTKSGLLQVDYEDASAENVKDVAFALVELLRNDLAPSGNDRLRKADAIYRYISSLVWEPDEFGERRELLRACAEVGWAAAGQRIERVESARRSPEPGRLFSCELCPAGAEFRSDLPHLGSPGVAGERGSEDLREYVDRCRRLLELLNSRPLTVVAEAPQQYELLLSSDSAVGFFDEREYYLGATAELTAGALRNIGRFEIAMRWLEVASTHLARTIDPLPLLVRLQCDQALVLYDWRKLHEALEAIPALIEATTFLQMKRDRLKCLIVQALSLKGLGRSNLALKELTGLTDEPDLDTEPAFKASVLLHIADLLGCLERHDEAMSFLEKALIAAQDAPEKLMRGNVLIQVGQVARLQGYSDAAASWYRQAVREFEALGMSNWSAYSRVLLAESLISANRHLEAELELNRALPTIEREHLVPEALIVSSLLRRPADTWRIDPYVVEQLRKHLEGSIR